jgi:hypothetical protein
MVNPFTRIIASPLKDRQRSSHAESSGQELMTTEADDSNQKRKKKKILKPFHEQY